MAILPNDTPSGIRCKVCNEELGKRELKHCYRRALIWAKEDTARRAKNADMTFIREFAHEFCVENRLKAESAQAGFNW